MDCLFCKIANHEIESSIVYEDDKIIAFNDINSQAPIHILLIPKKHIEGIHTITEEDEELLGYMLYKASEIAETQALIDGYRIVINSGKHGGQEVYHLHIHILGGRQMQWPPG